MGLVLTHAMREKDEWVRTLDQESGHYQLESQDATTTWYEPPEFVHKNKVSLFAK